LRGHPDCEGYEVETAEDFFDQPGFLPQYDFDKVQGRESFTLEEISSHRAAFNVRFIATGKFEGAGEKRREIFQYSELRDLQKWLPNE